MRPELPRQLVEQSAQLRTGFSVEVIDRFDQADAEESSPDAVDDGSGEIRVIGRGDPLGQNLARVGAGTPGRRGTVEVRRGDDFLGPRDRQLPARGGITVVGATATSFSGPWGGTSAKKAARLQNCSRFQLANG